MSDQQARELAKSIMRDELREIGKEGLVYVFQDSDGHASDVYTVSVAVDGKKGKTKFSLEQLTEPIEEARHQARRL